ncbi:MAG: methyltransferase domain-containing protein [Chloroflexi bacterium]|nr:methyltransferase domain-containing protein [Chloroflexota bacterium]
MERPREIYTTLVSWLNAAGDFCSPDVTVNDIGPHHWRRAAAVARHAGPGPKRVLELGAGGGYTAAALAERGHEVVAVEFTAAAAEQLRWWAGKLPEGSLTVVEDDFYSVELEGRFDAVCYFDGFGIGSDEEQRFLLGRVADWLKPAGCALVDVMTPWYWAAHSGEADEFHGLHGRFDFNGEACALRYRQWPEGRGVEAVAQVVRCCSPADLRLLFEGTGLRLGTLESYESERYARPVPIAKAMLYLATLVPGG